MKKVICFLILLSAGNVFPSVIEQVARELNPFSQKISVDKLKAFINENSILEYKEDLENQIDIVTTGEDDISFSALAYEFQSGWIHSGRNFGHMVFNDYNDDSVAQFILAAVIVLQYNMIQNTALIQCALEALRTSIINGSTKIVALLGEGGDTALSNVLNLMQQ